MTLIFCFTRIFRNSHRQIFGLDKLLQEGYQVVLLDMTGLFGGHPSSDDELMLELRRKCSSKADLVDFKKTLESKPVVYICNDTYLVFANDAFEILVREQDRLLAFKTKPSPFQIRPDKGFKLYLNKFLRHSPVSPVAITKPLYQRSYNYFVPDYFMCTTRHDLPLKALLTVKKENIFIAHSDDVNEIIEDHSPAFKEKRTGVFLDQVLPFAFKGEISEETYYTRTEKTLQELKRVLKLDKIVVAEHPESAALVEELRNRFKGFERQRGKTQKLIKNSTFVFAHYSTSIGIAVYYNKPVFLLIDDNLKRSEWISKAVKTYKRLLDLPLVDMEEGNLDQLKNITPNKILYKKYIKKYMKDSSIKNQSYHYAIKMIEKEIDKKNDD